MGTIRVDISEPDCFDVFAPVPRLLERLFVALHEVDQCCKEWKKKHPAETCQCLNGAACREIHGFAHVVGTFFELLDGEIHKTRAIAEKLGLENLDSYLTPEEQVQYVALYRKAVRQKPLPKRTDADYWNVRQRLLHRLHEQILRRRGRAAVIGLPFSKSGA
jgi:hypothetical protein